MLWTVSSAWSFVPGGPIGNGGDNWQVPVIGYGLPGDLLAPKNIGEEYRRVNPVMYYAYDANFLDFFGLVGMTNIDAAFGIMNGIANVSSYSWDLSEFPLESQQINYTAAAAGLADLKSHTLELLVEQMGLAEPERYVWTLHDRFLPTFPNAACPLNEEYLVVQRNLELIPTSFNQIQYSPYVNGTLYYFRIFEHCTGVNPLARTIPYAPDPFASTFTPVASGRLRTGNYYTTLTRDDVAGLRYLLSSNNVNYEATAPSGGQLVITNVLAPVLRTTLPFSLLLSQAATNDPATLLTNYPGLTFISVATNFVNAVTTNLTAYFTNLAGPYTNTVPMSNGMAVYATNGIVPFTNWSPVQYGTSPFALQTRPLGPLLTLMPFTDPVTLQLLYPGLLITEVATNYLVVQYTTNFVPYFTNQSVLPVFTNYAGGSLTNGFYFTNQPGPTVINYDLTDFSEITTMSLADFADRSVTNDAATLKALYPGLQILRSIKNAKQGFVTNYVSYLTNYIGQPYQGPPIQVTVAVSTNPVTLTNWVHTFGNVVTNNFYTNRLVWSQSIWTTNNMGAPYGSPFITNIYTKTNYSSQISGDFFIIPTNWCGFEIILTYPLANPPHLFGVTNTVIYSGYNTNGSTGTNIPTANTYALTTKSFSLFTNHTYNVRPGICSPVVQIATNYSTNVIHTYDYGFANLITNHYYSNTFVTVSITNVGYCPGGSPDLLCTNISVDSFYTNLPSGDFYIVPTNWCGYQFIGLLTNNIALTASVTASNSAGGMSYQETTVTYDTNYTYSVRPGVCEPALAFSTNYTTNIVTRYDYNFGSLVTNTPFSTNGEVTIVTTNLAIWTNGLVGWLTNIVTTNVLNNAIGGDFFIVPPAWCGYSILATQMTTAIFSTNRILTATNMTGVANLGQAYTETAFGSRTNATLSIQPTTCDTADAPSALRQGIERVEFRRANYDSLLGQFFAPITNTYTMVKITNSQPVVEFYQRVITQPDIKLTAQDLAPGPNGDPLVFNAVARGINFDQSNLGNGLAGPGTLIPRTSFVYNKVGSVYYNGSLAAYGLTTNAFLDETTQYSVLAWGSFDGSTNAPVVYPNGASIANLVNQLFIQVTPAGLADGTNGTPYGSVTFTVTGGQSPYTWSAPNFSTLVPGMSFNPGTATVSGTPSATGTFNFSLQVTDSANRTVNLNYSIIIH